MSKRILFLLLATFSLQTASAQFDSTFVKMNIRRCADSLTDAFKAGNWTKFTRYNYPALVGTLGGTNAFIEYIAQTFSHIPPRSWKKYEAGNILQLVKTEKDLQAVIELNSVLEYEGTRYTTTSYLVGESWDGGSFWTFFDSQGDLMAAKTVKPDLHPSIVLPDKKQVSETVK